MSVTPILSDCFIYPIKSVRGVSLSQSWVEERGLSFDRRYLLVRPGGEFITARSHHKLCLVRASLHPDGINISAPMMKRHLEIRPEKFSHIYREVRVWGSTIEGRHCHPDYDAWFSAFLGEPCQLYFMDKHSHRPLKRHPERELSFADGAPVLLTSQSSLDALNLRCTETIEMRQFRPNLVVSGSFPFAEDSWKKIRIGEVKFEAMKPSVRCNFTTLNPQTAEPSAANEPLQTLLEFRKVQGKNEVVFGINFRPLNSGQIQSGDAIEILELREPESYPDHSHPLPALPVPAELPSWPAGQALELRCIGIEQLTPTTRSFHLRPELPLAPHYLPGQYLTLELEIEGQRVNRCYTLSSSPSRPLDLTITVKQVPGGLVSNYLHQNLKIGSTLRALAPAGEFHIRRARRNKLALLSAGSGITPMLSMARWLTDTQAQLDIEFIYSASNRQELIAADELRLLARKNLYLKLHFILSRPNASDAWSGLRGRLDQRKLEMLVPDLGERSLFVCGSEDFMTMASEACQQLGLEPEHYLSESFGTPPETTKSSECQSTAPVTLEFSSWDQTVRGSTGETLLLQAEQAGVEIDSGCRSGVCGICRIKLLHGEVHTMRTGPLTADELNQGQVLACSCKPLSDLVIEKIES
ncbi:hybrid-cluster NAD(P)-dependent oxidoreductase [Dongshaea marina]|uniref:hybrid-cluster NAD(P)-dependent oxidoreductase n=1 Tax=Dongshaea marina TaxID=2047966 RepID=UPI000D3EBDAA|nr:hybrid-cluster NAD(P)-dependent oxidoreductase [Dongshaea marina]